MKNKASAKVLPPTLVPLPEPPKMKTFSNGQKIAVGVDHAPYTEGMPIRRIYCYGCRDYFRNYHYYLWRHGLCKNKPRGA